MTDRILDLSRYIETNPVENRPYVRGRRIPVAVIAYHARDNQWEIEELASAFDLSETEVLAVMLYYEQHKAEIDAQEAEINALYRDKYGQN